MCHRNVPNIRCVYARTGSERSFFARSRARSDFRSTVFFPPFLYLLFFLFFFFFSCLSSLFVVFLRSHTSLVLVVLLFPLPKPDLVSIVGLICRRKNNVVRFFLFVYQVLLASESEAVRSRIAKLSFSRTPGGVTREGVVFREGSIICLPYS